MMNAAMTQYDDEGPEYRVEDRRSNHRDAARDEMARSQQASYRRSRGRSPQQYNGIHRRRRKRISW